jgi:hypothetical protein
MPLVLSLPRGYVTPLVYHHFSDHGGYTNSTITVRGTELEHGEPAPAGRERASTKGCQGMDDLKSHAYDVEFVTIRLISTIVYYFLDRLFPR